MLRNVKWQSQPRVYVVYENQHNAGSSYIHTEMCQSRSAGYKQILQETELLWVRPASGPRASEPLAPCGLMSHDSRSSGVWIHISWTASARQPLHFNRQVHSGTAFGLLQRTNTNREESTYLSDILCALTRVFAAAGDTSASSGVRVQVISHLLSKNIFSCVCVVNNWPESADFPRARANTSLHF